MVGFSFHFTPCAFWRKCDYVTLCRTFGGLVICLLLCGLVVSEACARAAAGAEASESKTNASDSALSARSPQPQAYRRPAPGRRSALPSAFSKLSPAVSDLQKIEDHVKKLVERVSPAVVCVEVGAAAGSGVVISPDGLVLTAGHVCGKANRDVQLIFPDGKKVFGKSLGVDLETDCAIIKITNPGNWPCVSLAEATPPSVGDWVLALGHPGGFDLQRSLVVRLGRVIQLSPKAIQSDCTITTGDSGGPLLDMYGRVLAIHSYISRSVADNYHIPVARFYEGWDQLAGAIDTPEALAYFGASASDLSQGEGCRIDEITLSSPASRSGLTIGDIITTVDGREIRNAALFRRWVAESRPGDVLNIGVKRGAASLSFRVKLGSAPGKS